MYGHEVRLGQKFVQGGDLLGAPCSEAFVENVWIIGEDTHSQARTASLRNPAADPAPAFSFKRREASG